MQVRNVLFLCLGMMNIFGVRPSDFEIDRADNVIRKLMCQIRANPSFVDFSKVKSDYNHHFGCYTAPPEFKIAAVNNADFLENLLFHKLFLHVFGYDSSIILEAEQTSVLLAKSDYLSQVESYKWLRQNKHVSVIVSSVIRFNRKTSKSVKSTVLRSSDKYISVQYMQDLNNIQFVINALTKRQAEIEAEIVQCRNRLIQEKIDAAEKQWQEAKQESEALISKERSNLKKYQKLCEESRKYYHDIQDEVDKIAYQKIAPIVGCILIFVVSIFVSNFSPVVIGAFGTAVCFQFKANAVAKANDNALAELRSYESKIAECKASINSAEKDKTLKRMHYKQRKRASLISEA